MLQSGPTVVGSCFGEVQPTLTSSEIMSSTGTCKCLANSVVVFIRRLKDREWLACKWLRLQDIRKESQFVAEAKAARWRAVIGCLNPSRIARMHLMLISLASASPRGAIGARMDREAGLPALALLQRTWFLAPVRRYTVDGSQPRHVD